ncbi:NAD(P)/FAD-dependent oxidoreductase [Pseudogracilibacillus auburnensis]|uniref:Glucose inhibited division protein A n=1 Tax=Pseudogracilibacillus auburnensis TaxID=1494959 RepID=A0A2V3VPC8_9BACI|nr:FAD-dependent oxidoreductase [Pseudogracilibacillus auburnensis]MBO1001832.1 NAD(P)/FAD-dependent oxidoreductase [Pseudogracilibacillus auburnensis]PXW83380.1 glucose inhibited division protein A [Pseudogracilibacillus auburnensis]
MKYELVIIGAGLTGVEVALQAKKMGLESVLIVDYNDQFGGFNHSLLAEDAFEEEKNRMKKFKELPYEKWTNATVTGLFEAFGDGEHEINVQTKTGTFDIEAKKIIICSGALEKPREAHKIGGTRPAGVMTPTMALGLLDRGFLPGNQVVVYENSKTSRALSKLLENKGVQVTTVEANDYALHKVYGKSSLEKIEVKDKNNDEIESFQCDSLIFSEGFIPSTFYLKGTGIELNDKQFILTDSEGKTSVDNILAFGYCTDHNETSNETIEKSMKQLFIQS